MFLAEDSNTRSWSTAMHATDRVDGAPATCFSMLSANPRVRSPLLAAPRERR